MSINITRTPQPIAFAGCTNVFEVTSSGHTTAGTQSLLRFSIDLAEATPGDKVFLSIDSITITYLYDSSTSPVDDPAIGSAYRFTTALQLFNAIFSSYYLSGFTILANTASGNIAVEIRSNQPNGARVDITSQGNIIRQPISTSGSAPKALPNYRVAARYLVNDAIYTPWIFFTPVGDITTIDTSILSPYLPAPSIPSQVDTFQLYQLPSPYITCALQVAEYYGDSPVFQQQLQTDHFRLLPGELAQAHADSLFPDWHDAQPYQSILARPVVIGSHNASSSPLYLSQVDYLYIASFSEPATLTATIHLFSSSPEPLIYTHTLAIPSGTIQALPINPLLMGAADIHRTILLTIADASGTVIYTHTYAIQPSSPRTPQLYIADKYGLLRSFIPATMQRNVSFQADTLTLRQSRTQAVTSRLATLTLTSQPLPPHQADALADSLAFDRAYLHAGSSLYPVHVSPATFEPSTTARNLSSVVFDIFVQSRQLHPIPYALPATVPSPIPDFALLTELGEALATESGSFLVTQ